MGRSKMPREKAKASQPKISARATLRVDKHKIPIMHWEKEDTR